MISQPPAPRDLLEAAVEILEDVEDRIAEADEFSDPEQFADAVLNNLPAIAYALNAGLPVIAWAPIQKNPAEVQRVLRAVRQWSEQARSLIEALGAGFLSLDQFWLAIGELYVQQSTNAFIAGRRSVGNLNPLGPAAYQLLQAQQAADLARLTQQQADTGNTPLVVAGGGSGGGGLSSLIAQQFSPSNFVGSGLPGDPLKILQGGEGGKPIERMASRVEQFGSSISAAQSLGEMSGFEELPDEAVIVWWELGDADHCEDCINLADLSPFSEKALLDSGIFPGSGHTRCGANCACNLNYDLPSDVCGDGLTDDGSDVADDVGEAAHEPRPLPFLPAEDGRRLNVWVQEADSCQVPMSVSSFAGDPGDLDLEDEEDAFSWDEDLATTIEGDATASAVPLADALATEPALKPFNFLADYLKAEEQAAEQISRLRMEATNVEYRFAWRTTDQHVIFDFGRTTSGLSTLDPEMTMKALQQLSAKAAAEGKDLVINAETAGPGMSKWLDAMATDRVETRAAPAVVPKWDFVPGPVVSAEPEIAIVRPSATEEVPASWLVGTKKNPAPAVAASRITAGFVEAPTVADAYARIDTLLPNLAYKSDQTLTAMSLPQLNAILSALEDMNRDGFDLGQIKLFGDGVAAKAAGVLPKLGSNAGLTINGANIFLRQTMDYSAFEGVVGIEDLAATVRHEIMHTATAGLSAGKQAEIALLRNKYFKAGDTAKYLGEYAKSANSEWWPEFARVVTAPGYAAGDLPGDAEIWQAFVDMGIVKGPLPGSAILTTAIEPPAEVASLFPALPKGESVAEVGATEASDLDKRLTAGYADWAKALTESEREALQTYQLDSGGLLSAVLRKGESTNLSDKLAQMSGKQTVAERISAMDAAIARGSLPEDVAGFGGKDVTEVFRGAADTHGIPKVGAVVVDTGYMSTSVDAQIATSFARDTADAKNAKPILYRIALPKGSTAVYMDGYFAKAGELAEEREVLLPRNSAFRVEAVHENVMLQGGENAAPLYGTVVDMVPMDLPAVDRLQEVKDLPLPDLSATTDVTPNAAAAVGGKAPKTLLDDAAGNEFMVKHVATAQEEAATQIAADMGLRVVPATHAEAVLGVEQGSIQPIVSGAKSLSLADRPAEVFGRLTLDQAAEVQRQSVLDYVLANNDAHPGNFMTDSKGRLWGIDKNLSFRDIKTAQDDWAGAAFWLKEPAGSAEGYPGVLFGEALRHPNTSHVLNLVSPATVADSLDRLDAYGANRIVLTARGTGALSLVEGTEGATAAEQILRARIDGTRQAYEDAYRAAIKSADKVPPKWRDWLDSGGHFDTHPVGERPAITLPTPPGKALLPANLRASATETSYIGTNRAAWAAGFKPATTYEGAVERLGDLIGGSSNHLDGFSLAQLNDLLARAETLDAMGFDLGRVTRLDDFAKVSDAERHGKAALTRGHTIAVREDTKWQFFPESAMDQHPTVYDDMGGALAHEYGHVLLADANSATRKALQAIHDAYSDTTLSDYADQSFDEWMGEVVSAITAPGYVPGTLPFDQQVYETLADGDLLKHAELAREPIGPPIPATDVAAGWKPGDPQQYLVGDNPLPLNAPMAEWSGYVPPEPPLPSEVLKTSSADVADAKAKADAAWYGWEDVAQGRVDVALTWSSTEAQEAAKAGLVTRTVKGQHLAARDESAMQHAEAWLAQQGHSPSSDDFWHEVLGYDEERLGAIDDYEAIKGAKPKRLSAGVVMVEPDGRVWVLSPKNEFAGYQNTWIKGGVDDGETAAQAAIREMREETGFSVELDSYLGDYMNTDKTGVTRMYVGHRSGGGPLGAHLKETYKVRLLTPDEAAKALTRYGKADARDQTILADAVDAVQGKATTSAYIIGSDEVGGFSDLLTANSMAQVDDSPARPRIAEMFGINPRPVIDPPPSAAFAYDKGVIADLEQTAKESPPPEKFPYYQTTFTLPDGTTTPKMFWQLKPDAQFGQDAIFWANAKQQVIDPHLRFNLHVAQLKRLLQKMADDPNLGWLRVNETLLDQVPELRELLKAAGAETTGTVMSLPKFKAMGLLDSLKTDAPLVKEVPFIPTAAVVPEATHAVEVAPAIPTVDAGKVGDLLASANPHPTAGADLADMHLTYWQTPGAQKWASGWVQNASGDLLIAGAMPITSEDVQREMLTANILHASHVLDLPGLGGSDLILSAGMVPAAAEDFVKALGATPEGTSSWRLARDKVKAFADSFLTSDEYVALATDKPALFEVDWAIPSATKVPDPVPAIAEQAVTDAPVLAQTAQTMTADSSALVKQLDEATDAKVTFAEKPMTATTYPSGTVVTWRRLGNVLEVHAVQKPADGAMSAQILRMAKAMDEAPKISDLRFVAGTVAQGGDAEKMLLAAGGKKYVGGIRLTRDQTLALRDQLVASAKATEAAAAKAPEFVATLGPQYGFDAAAAAKISPLLIPLKQGFSKIEYAVPGGLIGSVKIRTLSKEIVWDSLSGGPIASQVAVARLAAFHGDLLASTAIEKIRFTNLDQIPTGIKQMLIDRGATSGVDSTGAALLYLDRDAAYKLSLDLKVEMKGTTVGLGPKTVAAAVEPEAVKAPEAAVAQTFWEVAQLDQHEVLVGMGDIGHDTYKGYSSGALKAGSPMLVWPDGTQIVVSEEGKDATFWALWVDKASPEQVMSAVLQYANKVAAGDYEHLVLKPVFLDKLGPVTQALKMLGAGPKYNDLIIGPETAQHLVDSLSGKPIEAIAAEAGFVEPAAKSFASQWGIDPTLLDSLSLDDITKLSDAASHETGLGEIAMGQGVPWVLTPSEITLKVDPAEAPETMLSIIASLYEGPLTAGPDSPLLSLTVNLGTKVRTVKSDILQAAGASMFNGTAHLTYDQAKELASKVANDLALPKVKAGSAIADMTHEPSIADILDAAHPGIHDDPSGWANLIDDAHTTTGPLQSEAKNGLLPKAVNWPMGHAELNIVLASDDPYSVATAIRFESLASGTTLVPSDWAELAVATFHDIGTKLGTAFYGDVDSVILSQFLMESVPETKAIGQAFGGVVLDSGDMLLTTDQAKALAKAIDEQLVQPANLAPPIVKADALGATADKANWGLAADASTPVEPLPDTGLVSVGTTADGSAVSWVTKLGGTVSGSPTLIALHTTTPDAIVWTDAFAATGTSSIIAGEDLANAYAVFVTQAAKTAAAQGKWLMISNTVLDQNPGLKGLVQDVGAHLGTHLGIIGKDGYIITAEEMPTFLDALSVEVNPLKFRAPGVVIPGASSYDADKVSKALLDAPSLTTSELGGMHHVNLFSDGAGLNYSYEKMAGNGLLSVKVGGSAVNPETTGMAMAALVAKDAKAAGAAYGHAVLPMIQSDMLTAYPKLGDALEQMGWDVNHAPGGSATLLPDKIDAFLAKVSGTKPGEASQLLDPWIAKAGANPEKVKPFVATLTADMKETLQAQGFGKWTDGATTIKFRQSGTTITLKGATYLGPSAQLVAVLKVGEHLDAAPGLSKVVIESVFLQNAALFEDIPGLGAAVDHLGNITIPREDFLKFRDAVKADLAGLPAPVGAAASATVKAGEQAVTEPLAQKLHWDLSKAQDLKGDLPQWGGYKKQLNLKDTVQPYVYNPAPGQPATWLSFEYRDYSARVAYLGQTTNYAGTLAGSDAQRAAGRWLVLQKLADKAGADGKALFVSDVAAAQDERVGRLLDLYGAKAKSLKVGGLGDGREITAAQAKQMATDMADNAAVTGAVPVSTTLKAAAAAPVLTAEQQAAQDLATFTKESVLGTKDGVYAGLIADKEAGEVVGKWAGLDVASVHWATTGYGKTLTVESVGYKTSLKILSDDQKRALLGDFAYAADKSDTSLLIKDGTLQELGVTDDLGGLIYWAPADDAWTTDQPSKLADALLGKTKTPTGSPLVKPVAAPPPPPEVKIPAKPNGISDAYGWTAEDAKGLADGMMADNPTVKVSQISASSLTQTYESAWSNGITIRWAEEQQGDARILRVRSVTDGQPSKQAAALVAGLMGQWPAYLGEHTNVARLLIEKKALTNTPGLSVMLKDAGWKETKDYWVVGRDGVGDMSKALADDQAEWMANTAIPVSTPAAGWSGALPTKPTPSFIYDYNPATHQSLYGSIVDKDIGPIDLGGGPGAGHELTVGKIKVTWSVSPSGNTVGIGAIDITAGATNAEKVDSMMAAIQKIAEQMQGRSGNLWIKPTLYQQVPGLSQVMKDAGGVEAQFAKLGDAIQMNAAQAGVLAKALGTDDMTGLTISIATSSEYLGYNADLAKALYVTEPQDMGKGVLRWATGATGSAKTTEVGINLSTDGQQAVLNSLKADPSVATLTVAAQLNWFVTHGASDVTISKAVVDQIPKLDKFLVSLGGSVTPDGVRLTDKALYDTRAALLKNALPVPLGGDAKKFAFTIADTMIASPAEVLDAVHSELVTTVGAKSATTFIVGGRAVKMTFAQSDGNIFWEAVDRGGATIGQTRSAEVAQLRSFVNLMAQNAMLDRLDVSVDLLATEPGLRAVLKKYGAVEVAAQDGRAAFLSLSRAKAMKLRYDLEKEIGADASTGATTFIGKQAALVQWPTADDLSLASSTAKLGGQTEKVLLKDAQGNEWLFKPGASGQGAAADKAAADLAALLGLPVPPVRIYTVNVGGKVMTGSLQKMVPGVKGITLSSMTATQQQQLWKHEVLDWLTANDDAHIENWLWDEANGQLWGIDKTRAWKTFLDPKRDALDINSLGQGGSEAMAPLFFKWWKDVKRNPALLSNVHPNTLTAPLRALRAIDDTTYRSIVTPFAKIAADANPRFRGDVEKMIDAMVARKNSAATDLEGFLSKQLADLKRSGVTLPPEWEKWLKDGGHLNLDATPEDLLKERMAANDSILGGGGREQQRILTGSEFSRVNSMMQAGYGSGVTGATSGAGKVAFGAGHVSHGGYGYEKVRPTLRSTAAGAALADKWEMLNENLILHALFDTDTSWAPSSWVTRLREYYNSDRGTIRVIRSTSGYGANAAASYAGYTRDGFRNLFSTALGDHVTVGGHGIWIYADVDPGQIFSSPFGGFSGWESEFAVADLRIDQVALMTTHALGSRGNTVASKIMGYNGPVVGS